jgi:integrase
MNSDFIKLSESRLRDLKKKRSTKFFKENDKLIKNLILIWGSKKEITRQDVEDYLHTIKSPFVANIKLRLIKALFNHGIKREWFLYNPAGRVEFMPVKKKRKYIPSREDVKKVLAVVKDEQRNYLLTIINTLARVNEINKLKWSDVYDDYLVLQTRKAKNSNLKERNIPLNKTLQGILKDRKEGYVFSRRGKPYGYRSKFLKNACDKAKVKQFGFHALRHYGASILANANIPLSDIQEILGHEQITTTAIYIQSLKGSVIEAVKKLED